MSMALFDPDDERFVRAVADLAFCNPFQPQRLEFEARALGRPVSAGRVWSRRADEQEPRPELSELANRLAAILDRARMRLSTTSTEADAAALATYEDASVYLLYDRYRHRLDAALSTPRAPLRFWAAFEAEFEHYLRVPGLRLPTRYEAAHLLACFFQVRRAFDAIFSSILGTSSSAAELRASCWQSIFTLDLRAYAQTLYTRMADFTTLIVGPSGTGKELVARAIARARYIPIESGAGRLTEDPDVGYFALNLAALSPTLIESELFGHSRGSFTGAVGDHQGYLEACAAHGTVFLDEIGELDPLIQVKLLRVIQDRTFARVGETKARVFRGKVVAATHRDLPARIEEGRFRGDFYYRLCSDVIRTPPLARGLAEAPDDLFELVRFFARRATGDDRAGDRLAQRAVDWIETHLGRDYTWPGNIRELEQCVRGILIRGTYEPHLARRPPSRDGLLSATDDATITADELLRRYARVVHRRTGSYVAAGRRLGLDRRTVRRLVEAVPGDDPADTESDR